MPFGKCYKYKRKRTGHCRQVSFNKGSIPLTSDIIHIPSGRVNGQVAFDNLKATSARLTKREHIDREKSGYIREGLSDVGKNECS
ncbi:hypothetical protein Tco_0434092 [Tanacetum coccineum]